MADIIIDDKTETAEEKAAVGEDNAVEKPVRVAMPPKPQRAAVKITPPPPIPPVKKKKKRSKLKIILIIVIAVLVAGFVFEELYFNFLGIRDVFIDAVVRLDPAYGKREQALDDRENELDKRETELDAREKSVDFRQSQNERRSKEIEAREEDVNDREQRATPLFQRKMTEQEQLDLLSLSRSYSLMPPEAAVAILMEIERPDDVAVILYNMREQSASAILAVMDPEFAAAITELLLFAGSETP